MSKTPVEIAAEILVAALTGERLSFGGSTAARAKEIAEAFTIIHKAVADAASEKPS